MKVEKKIVIDATIGLFSIIFLLSFTFILIDVRAYAHDKATYEAVREEAVTTDTEGVRMIDFVSITKGTGICSWIYIPGTGIDYPVVRGDDNDFYLNHDVNAEDANAGAIFMDCDNAEDLSDIRTVIYGHNMKDGTMFHDLHKFRTDASYGDNFPYMYIYLNNDYMYRYELLCTISTTNEDVNIYGVDTPSLGELTQALLAEADNVYAEANGQNLVLLSTCISGNKRFVVVYQKALDQDIEILN